MQKRIGTHGSTSPPPPDKHPINGQESQSDRAEKPKRQERKGSTEITVVRFPTRSPKHAPRRATYVLTYFNSSILPSFDPSILHFLSHLPSCPHSGSSFPRPAKHIRRRRKPPLPYQEKKNTKKKSPDSKKKNQATSKRPPANKDRPTNQPTNQATTKFSPR